jgi:FKBP-type peptidyl-prolyl cis-trans isomerase
MNCAVGSREPSSPMERSGRISLAVKRALSGLAVAALLTGATLVNAQTSTPAAGAQPATAPAAKKSATGGTGTAGAKDKGAAAADSPKSKASYAIGVSVGETLRRSKVDPDAISVEKISQGIRDSLSGKTQMSQEYQTQIMEYLQKAHTAAAEAEAGPNHKAAEAFLAENGKKKDVVTTATGLQYKVIAAGSGDGPKLTDQVSVNYRGTLLNGTEFDASAKHGGPATFGVNQVIPGWTEALQLMKPGAKFQLWIPPKLAYDLNSPPSIPPGSLLVFDVELVGIKPPAAPAAGAPPGAAPPGHPAIPPPPK